MNLKLMNMGISYSLYKVFTIVYNVIVGIIGYGSISYAIANLLIFGAYMGVTMVIISYLILWGFLYVALAIGLTWIMFGSYMENATGMFLAMNSKNKK